ncbi:PhzF family phenazine biosynthesis protein [Corynebacterium aurimucosum]|uniref:PhzF family phenazine biosynthesis protein n=1 Tax=Corynebacterium aurimucosum TaxID=169292 RepID=A0A558GH44_9CORY|nr:PhzF family phenazine biosynthesis protein [Corynebacterium aurimucosum]
MQHRFFEVDVFATGPFTGNPLAVVADADGLSTEEMQRIAHWTNFSETTFLCSPTDPGADYRVRIFTPHEEFPFAGHPTLGSARVAAELLGKSGTLIQECGVGLVTVRQEEGRFAFATPPLLRHGELSEAERSEAAAVLGIDEESIVDSGWVDNGPGWRLVQLESAETVRQLRPTPTPGVKVGVVGLTGDTEPAYEVRAITGQFEDPVTGSFNGGAAQFLRAKGAVPARYTAAQGSQIGRDGRVFINDDGDELWVGGNVHIRVRGTLGSRDD